MLVLFIATNSDKCAVTRMRFVCASHHNNMKQIELTSKLVLAIIGLAAVSAILIPTYAVPPITSADIVDNTIQSVDIKDGEVKTPDLANNAVTTAKIQDGQVFGSDIADVTIGAHNIADNAITSSKLAGGAVKPNIHTVRGTVVTIGPGESEFASTDCPSREILTGGGFEGSQAVSVSNSAPSDKDTWLVEGRNQNPDNTLFIIADALCMGAFP